MLARVNIRNFKSIRDLEFPANRVNVFIGEPNTGKSNILEALALFSEGLYRDHGEVLKEILRFKNVSELFFDRELSESVEITADDFMWSLKFENSLFQGNAVAPNNDNVHFSLDSQGRLSIGRFLSSPIRYYRFKTLSAFNDNADSINLREPYGSNLAMLFSTNKHLRRLAGDVFRERGFRLVIDTERNDLLLSKEVDEQLYSFSYPTVSETLRRIVFFMAVLETNRNAVILLDEPEANTFPFYTTYLAERIALNEHNQFFLSTHNPYVLSSIVAKTPSKDLNVFVTTMDSYRTRVKLVPKDSLPRILDYGPDAFLNLDKLVE